MKFLDYLFWTIVLAAFVLSVLTVAILLVQAFMNNLLLGFCLLVFVGLMIFIPLKAG
jgi:hypothetical protein